jgi:hypothetical protein
VAKLLDSTRGRLHGAEVFGGRFAGLGVCNEVEGDLLALFQLLQLIEARAFNRADMRKNVIAAICGLDETIALLRVEPLYSSFMQRETFLSDIGIRAARDVRRPRSWDDVGFSRRGGYRGVLTPAVRKVSGKFGGETVEAKRSRSVDKAARPAFVILYLTWLMPSAKAVTSPSFSRLAWSASLARVRIMRTPP